MMGHKPGCIWADEEAERAKGCFHRTPIDCCTVEDLQGEITRLKGEVEVLKVENRNLKAEIYDLEHEIEEGY